VNNAARCLTTTEFELIKNLANLERDKARSFENANINIVPIPIQAGVASLLEKEMIRSEIIEFESGKIFYALTPFGWVVWDKLKLRAKM
jgi:hypothetical protein